MFLRLRILGSLLSFFVSPTFTVLGQPDEKVLRIEEGRRFLENREKDWKSCLEKAPLYCGKMSSRFQNRVTFEGWFTNDHALRIYFSREGDANLILRNPEYIAALTLNKSQKVVLTHVSPTGNFSSRPSPLMDMSLDVNGTFLPISLKHENIKIDDFQAHSGGQTIRFVPTREKDKFKFIELQFRDDTRPLPSKYLDQLGDSSHRLYSVSEFVNVEGFLLPLRMGVLKSSTHPLTLDDQPTEFVEYGYSTSDILDESRCYLSYYGLREPDLKVVADFTERKYTLKFLIGFASAGILVISLLVYYRRKYHGKNVS